MVGERWWMEQKDRKRNNAEARVFYLSTLLFLLDPLIKLILHSLLNPI